MNEKLNIWHLVGSTSTLAIFIITSYVNLSSSISSHTEKIEHNQAQIHQIKEEMKDFESLGVKILLELKNIESRQNQNIEILNEIKAQNKKFETDIDKFYQLNKNLNRP